MQKIGSGLGSGGFIAYDDTACMVRVALQLSEFLCVESCGRCTPCKFGTNQATSHLHKLVHGLGDRTDLEFALEGAAMAPHANRCYLPVEHSLLTPSIVRSFGREFEQHFNRGCQSCRDTIVPKIVDFDPPRRRSPTSVPGAWAADRDRERSQPEPLNHFADSRRLPQYKRTIVGTCASTLIMSERREDDESR